MNPADATLSTMPRFDRYQKLTNSFYSLINRGITRVDWNDTGTAFTYFDENRKLMQYDVASKTSKTATKSFGESTKTRFNRQAPGRGEQYSIVYSENGKFKAQSRAGNVVLIDAKTDAEIPLTTDGGQATRIKYGTASWVYGEELGVKEAMWFSPDSKFLGFYQFDERPVKDYYIGYNQLKDQDTLNTEAYPIPGAGNPLATLLIYDLKSKKTIKVDSNFVDPTLGEYVFEVHWSPQGKELLFYRSNRLQNTVELCAANPESGACRVVLKESRIDGWVDTNRYSNLHYRFLKDKTHFLWISDSSGFRNLYLGNLDGSPLVPLTHLDNDVESIAQVDETSNWVYFNARNGDNPYQMQLNRVHLDGTGEQLLTDPSLSHACSVAPAGGDFVDFSQSLSTPPVTNLCAEDGKVISQLSKADVDAMVKIGVKPQVGFTVLAADGKTVLYGKLGFPSDFDPNKKYPMIVNMYGGPESGGATESYDPSPAVCEFGFVSMTVDGRGSSGRGRAFMCSVYRKLGQYEIDDCAATVKELCAKYSYLNAARVGIQGTSYGGYFSALSLIRYPDVYRAACSSSPVTDFRLYDSIYTERYMGLPTADDNLSGYEAGSCIELANNLKGYLQIYYGSSDNNVHNVNTLRLIQKLDDLGKRYTLLVGPDQGHSQMSEKKMWEYFITHLILESPIAPTGSAYHIDSKWKANRLVLDALMAHHQGVLKSNPRWKKP